MSRHGVKFAPFWLRPLCRRASALQAGLLLAPGGLGAMLMMPLSGKLTDRYGPTWLPATA